LRDECLALEEFASLVECQVLTERWRQHYNTQRPHSRLGYQTPSAFYQAWRTKQAGS